MAGRADEVRRVLFEFVADSKDLQRESKAAGGSLDSTTKSANKMTGALNKIKPAAAAAGAAAAAMAAKWAFDGIKMAETAEVAAASFEKTFGPAAQGLTEDMEEQRIAMGLSTQEFQKMATQIGAVNVGMGQTEAEAAAVSQEMIKIAADVAAFNGELNNAPQVIDDMNSALVGNYETLDKYGINLTAAAVDQKALADTGKGAASELTELEKRTAALALITEQSALMTGSFAEQTDSAAVKQNIFNAKMADAQTKVGAALLPLKELVLEVLLALVPLLDAINPLLGLLTQIFSGLTTVLTPVIRAVGTLVGWFVDLIETLWKLLVPIDKIRDAFWRLGNQIRETFSWTPPAWMQNMGIKGFHSGGVVPGPRGSEQLIRAQGGERVVPAGAGAGMMGGGGGGTNVTINVQAGLASPNETARAIVDLLENYTETNGPVAIQTRSA